MNTDIRIAVSFPDHPKTIALRKRCGAEGIDCLIRLWCWVAVAKPDGVIRGMDADDLEAIAQWKGPRGAFLSALLEVPPGSKSGFFRVGQNCTFFVHEWKKWNAWACDAEKRRVHAKKMAAHRWSATRSKKKDLDAASMPEAYATDMPRAYAPFLSLPSGRTRTRVRTGTPPKTPPEGGVVCATGFDRVWETYPHHQRRSRKTEARERWSAYKLEPLTENVLAHLEADRNTRDWQRDDGSFVPGMQVWLRRRRLDFRSPPEQPQQAEDWEDKFVRGEP